MAERGISIGFSVGRRELTGTARLIGTSFSRLRSNAMNDKVWLNGKAEIGQALGKGPGEVLRLIREEGLPAWRETPTSSWKVLPEDLRKWARERARQYKMPCQHT
jgi:hypothetical protein